MILRSATRRAVTHFSGAPSVSSPYLQGSALSCSPSASSTISAGKGKANISIRRCCRADLGEPEGGDQVFSHRRLAFFRPGYRRRRDSSLSRRARRILWHRYLRMVSQPTGPNLAPAVGDLLDRHRVHRRRAVPRTVPRRQRSRRQVRHQSSVCRPGNRGGRQFARRDARPEPVIGRAMVLVWPSRVGIFGTRSGMADFARCRAGLLADLVIQRRCTVEEPSGKARDHGAVFVCSAGHPFILSTRHVLRRRQPFLRRECGVSGSSTFGSRAFSSCSLP